MVLAEQPLFYIVLLHKDFALHDQVNHWSWKSRVHAYILHKRGGVHMVKSAMHGLMFIDIDSSTTLHIDPRESHKAWNG